MEDFSPDSWEEYFDELMEKSNEMTKVVEEYYTNGFSMSVKDLIDLRSRLNVASYFVSEALLPVAMSAPYWRIRIAKAKEEAMPEAINKFGGVTAARELIESMESVSKAYKIRGLIEATISTVKLSISAAENVSHAIVGKIKGNDITELRNDDNKPTETFGGW